MLRCRAPHGARGLKLRGDVRRLYGLRRAPHGARGLKLEENADDAGTVESRPTRGAWIETLEGTAIGKKCRGRAPHGARGLKQIRLS